MATTLTRAVATAQVPSGRAVGSVRRGHVARRGSGLAMLGDVCGAVSAVSHALTATPPYGYTVPSRRPESAPTCTALKGGLEAELEYRPALSVRDYAQAAICSAAVCAAVYLLVPSHLAGWRLAAGLALLLLLLLRACLALQTERKLQERMSSETDLAAPDSLFQQVLRIQVHYKRAVPRSASASAPPPSTALHCYHGFGANTFSWAYCQQTLADKLNAVVTAHDSPGFGLTQRPPGLDAYTSAFNGKVGRGILEVQAGRLTSSASDAAGGPGAPRRVLMGHSMGGAAVVEEVVANPAGIDAVVLISPAVIALSSSPSAPDAGRLRRAAAAAGNVVAVLASSVVGLVLLLLQPLLVWLLRAAVRSRGFWERGLQSAWYDKRGVTAELVDAYRMPQLVKGWEGGMLRFVRAKLTGPATTMSRLRSATEPVMLLSMAERFAAAAAEHNIRVLLVHGQQDALVPVSNSRRLAALLGCRLIEVERCGHQPQEEVPEQFATWVADFVEA